MIYIFIENILDFCVFVFNINFIIDVDNGIFGFFLLGILSNIGFEIEFYLNVMLDFMYVVLDLIKFIFLDGEYIV